MKEKKPTAPKKQKRVLKVSVLLKVVILNLGNVVLVAVSFVLISKLPEKAGALAEKRIEFLHAQEQLDSAVIQADLEKNQSAAKELTDTVNQDSGLLSFITRIDELKASGRVSEFSILTNSPITDKTKNKGIPIQLVLRGSATDTAETLRQVQAMPFLIRPITTEIIVSGDGSVEIKYGAFIYVNNE